MLCKKCGTNVLDGIKFCPNCGSSLEEAPVAPVAPATPEVTPAAPAAPVTPTAPVTPVTPVAPVNNVPPVMPVNNGVYAPQQMNNQNKSNNGLIIVIVAIVVGLIVCIAIIAAAGKKGKDNPTSNTGSNTTSNIVSNTTSNIVSNTTSNIESNITSNITSNTTSNIVSNTTSNVTSNTTTGNTVTFKGYNLEIPSNYKVSYNGTQLQLMGTNNSDIAVISIQDGAYETLKTNSATIDAYIKNSGYTIVKNTEVKQLNGVEFLTVEVDKSGQKMALAYAKLAPNKIFLIVIGNTYSTIDYNQLALFANTIKTAKPAA